MMKNTFFDFSRFCGVTIVACACVAECRAELIHHSTFDDVHIDGMTVTDQSTYGNHGLIEGPDVLDVPGIAGQALEFPGFDTDFVDYGDVLNPLSDDFSVSVWFDADPEGGAEFVVSKGNSFSGAVGWSIWMEQGSVFVRGQQVEGTNPDRFGMHEPNVLAGQHHAVLVLDRTEDQVRGYLDGEPMSIAGGGGSQTDQLIPGSEILNTDFMLVGRRSQEGAPLIGWVDDLQLYDDALTVEDVLYLFENPGTALGTDALHAGDADMDRDFDQLDLVQVQIAAKYLTGEMATWGEGDWNGAPGGEPGNPPPGDGVFDQLDIIAALSSGTYLKGPMAMLAVSRNDAPVHVAVPEPAAVSLAALGFFCVMGRYRRERRRGNS